METIVRLAQSVNKPSGPAWNGLYLSPDPGNCYRGRSDKTDLMATESTEEHEKIRL